MGLTAYRFSISWSRILPQGRGQLNFAGIDHYNMLINELLLEGIEPFVTLYHWDLPQALEDEYDGWLSPDIAQDFVNYADVCFRNFGDRVRKWVTINEPWTICFQAYQNGDHAPGRCSDRSKCSQGNSSTEPYLVAHNLLNAHASVVSRYRQEYQRKQRGEIGIVLNQDWAEPWTSSTADMEAAARRREFQLGWFADPIFFGHYPPSMRQEVGHRLPHFTIEQQEKLVDSLDFLGLNHYSTKYYSNPNATELQTGRARDAGWNFDQHATPHTYDPQGTIIGAQGESPWLNVVPWGFYNVLMYVHNRYAMRLEVLPVSSAATVDDVTATTNSTSASSNSPTSSSTRSTYQSSHSGGGGGSGGGNGDGYGIAGAPVGRGGLGRKGVPIYVTENGCDVPNESKLSIAEALHDAFRINYLSQYLEQGLQQALRQGVDIRGYFVWSLLDNYEWADGYDKRFGIVYVDFSNDENDDGRAAYNNKVPINSDIDSNRTTGSSSSVSSKAQVVGDDDDVDDDDDVASSSAAAAAAAASSNSYAHRRPRYMKDSAFWYSNYVRHQLQS